MTAPDAPLAFSADQNEVHAQATAYGLATYEGRDGNAYAVVTRRHTPTLGIFRLVPHGATVSYVRVDTLDLPATFRLPNGQTWSPCLEPGEGPQLEGMAVDPATKTLYAAQEDVALWRIPLASGRFAGAPKVVEHVREYGVPATFDPVTEECVAGPDPGFGGRIAADVEGVSIRATGPLTGQILVSSQGDSTFYTYDRRTNRPRAHITVVDGTVDGVQHSDGAAVTPVPLPGYPHGLLVVHDGENRPDGGRVSTNFKYLNWPAGA